MITRKMMTKSYSEASDDKNNFKKDLPALPLLGIVFSELKAQVPGGGVLNKVLYGEAPPRGPTLYPFIYHFGRKGTPFIYLLLKEGTPFTHLF